MTGWTWLWIGWLAYFGVVETVAVVGSMRAKRAGIGDPRDTLSEHLWAWFGTAPGTKPNSWAYARRAVLVGFLAWLAVHLVGGGQLM